MSDSPSATPEPGVSSEDTPPSTSSRVSVWDNIPLHVTKWEPSGEVRAIMYLSHGVGEHLGRYEQLGEVLAESGILLYGHDHVGHGKSGGDRVHINTFDTYVQDILAHVRDMKESYPDIPCFLMGHSMGGLISVLIAIENQELFNGVIFSGASVESDVSGLLAFINKIVASIFPQMGVKSLDTNLISSLPEEVKMYEEDPLVYHGKLKAKWGDEFLQAVESAQEGLPAINIPALIFHGTDDQIVPISSSEIIESRITSTDKTFERFEGNFHEVLRDRGQERARNMIRDWLFSHIG